MSLFKHIDISEHLKQGMLLLSREGEVLAWNSWMQEQSKMSLAAVEGKSILDLFPSLKGRPSFSRMMSAFTTNSAVVLSPAIHQYFLPLPPTLSQQSKGVEFMFQLTQGQLITVEIEKKEITCLLILINDVTENYLLNKKIQLNFQEIQKKNEQLDIARQHSASFLANMSHELRTPLNSILVLSQLLSENSKGDMSNENIDFADTIHRSGKGLLRLINDVLDLAKVEAGRLDITLEPFVLRDLLEVEKGIFNSLLVDKEFLFEISIDKKVPDYFYSDSHRLSQILRNFLSNAFKFTKKGKVVLTVSRHSNIDGIVDALCFSVLDSGIGIVPEKQEEVFEPFKQADGSISREYGGTGLGLSICKELAEMLGGTISMTSVLGVGSTFNLVLPFKESDIKSPLLDTDTRTAAVLTKDIKTPYNLRESAPSSGILMGELQENAPYLKNSRGKKILLVENEIRDMYKLTAFVESLEMSVISALTGPEGRVALKEQGGDIVLMDMKASDDETLVSIKEIREGEEYYRIPLFAIVEVDKNEEYIQKIKDVGVDEVFTKPVDIDLLARMIGQYLAPRHKR